MSASKWGANPSSGDWNTATNWYPAVVPTSTAAFEASSRTAITFSATGATGVLPRFHGRLS